MSFVLYCKLVIILCRDGLFYLKVLSYTLSTYTLTNSYHIFRLLWLVLHQAVLPENLSFVILNDDAKKLFRQLLEHGKFMCKAVYDLKLEADTAESTLDNYVDNNNKVITDKR